MFEPEASRSTHSKGKQRVLQHQPVLLIPQDSASEVTLLRRSKSRYLKGPVEKNKHQDRHHQSCTPSFCLRPRDLRRISELVLLRCSAAVAWRSPTQRPNGRPTPRRLEATGRATVPRRWRFGRRGSRPSWAAGFTRKARFRGTVVWKD